MGPRSSACALAFSLALTTTLAAAPLPVPKGLQAEAGEGGLSLSWEAVTGAGLYRVAVFDAPEKDGKRPLLAAVWVKGHEYAYGQTLTVPKAGKYPSTKPLPLPSGHKLRVMVAAALADGNDKGEWAGLDVESAASAKAKVEASATPSPIMTATPSPTPGKPSKDAELEVQGGEEFKQTPDAAVLDVDDAGDAAAGGAAATGALNAVAGSATGAASAAATTSSSADSAQATTMSATVATADVKASGTASTEKAAGSTPWGEAKGLLSAGKFELAETAYRNLLEKEPENADAWEGLGDSFAGRKMKLEAKESYEKALSLNKTKTHLRDWIDKNVRH